MLVSSSMKTAPEPDEKAVEALLEEYEVSRRSFTGKMKTLISAIAIIAAIYHIYSLGVSATSVTTLRTVHLMFGLILIPLIYPACKKHLSKVHPIDWLLIIGGMAVSLYVLMQDENFILRAGVNPTTNDIIFGAMAILIILEVTRRVIGMPLVLVTLFFFVYALFGYYFPGIFISKSFKLEYIISYVYNVDGIYGIPIGVSSTYVLLFIVFGAFLKNSGAGEFYTNFSYALAGKARGGPAKVAVVSSALFGTISGSGIANVVTTGSITIPLMKRAGFRSYYAAAIEAVASTGGQIMPPIMGAAAFIMAEIVGVPYSQIMISAALPALLYFIAVYFIIDFQAGKLGLVGLKAEELPIMGQVFKEKGHLVLPLFVLMYALLLENSTPIRAAFLSIVSTILVSWIKADTRMGIKKIGKSLEEGVLSCMEVISACACAGIIMALVSMTGLGLKLSTLIIQLSGSHLIIALLFTAVVVIILSMGLPTTACYIISATILAPALAKMGISVLQAHMFIFYYACLSGITPPVALVAYPAAAIAKANPVKVSFTAFKIGIVGFLVPFMFIYSPALFLQGDIVEVLLAVVTSLVGCYIIALAIEGWFKVPINNVSRFLFFGAGLCLMKPGFLTDVAGVVLILVAIALNKFFKKPTSENQGG